MNSSFTNRDEGRKPVALHSNSPWLVVRHVAHEGIGTLATSLERAGIAYRHLDVFRGEPVPESPADLGGLIVMGGPMGVYEADRYPFLAAEMNLIRSAAHAGLPVLGICLGSQLIAGALGALVYPGGRKEIGWFPVEVVTKDNLTSGLPARFMAFHWHGDTFELPAGATRLFRSDLYENQGFRWGANVLAIQFHFEITAAMVDDWLADGGCRTEVASAPGLTAETIRSETAQNVATLEDLSKKVFASFLRAAAS
jgi:GMP synthase (glutamine-hydrolysing)